MANADILKKSSELPQNAAQREPALHRAFPFGFYLVGGVLIYLFGSNTFSLFLTNRNAVYEWGLALGFLLCAFLMRRSRRFQRYWQVAFVLFVAAFANALTLLLGNWLARLLPVPGSQAELFAIDKLSQAITIVLPILLLTLLSGEGLGSIFLQKGDLKEGLRFGLISFGIFAAIFIAIAILQSNAPSSTGLTATGVSLNIIVAAIPWILIFIFANSFMEELWFRGISLGKLSPILGVKASVLVTALVFGSMHLGATYVTPAQMILFAGIAFGLGLVNGSMMLKTGSIWGSVLFHAGYDLLVIIPIFAS